MYTPPLSRTPSPPPVIFSEMTAASSSNVNSIPQVNGQSTQERQESSSLSEWWSLKELDFDRAYINTLSPLVGASLWEDLPTCKSIAPSLVGASPWKDIPAFAIITGRNGSGKSQLLNWIQHTLKLKGDVSFVNDCFEARFFRSQHDPFKTPSQSDDSLSALLTKLQTIETHYMMEGISENHIFTREKLLRPSYWEELNLLLQQNKINLRIQGGSKHISCSRKQQNDQEVSIPLQDLSSGEKLVIDIFCWQHFLQLNGDPESKVRHAKIVDVILLDEPDRHFDPDLCKVFMTCLQHMAKKNKIQIIMTTHRTDTLAYAPEGSIFTIKRNMMNGGPAKIELTSRLSALFRLTPNLRELTSSHIKIHTESHDDATFYERIYTHLLTLSEEVREKNKNQAVPKKEILSRRFQLSFYSQALDNQGAGGGCAIIPPTVQRDMLALDNLDARSTTKTLIPRRASYPLGLLDADTDLDATLKIRADSTRIKPAFTSIKPQLFFTKRYSLENYVYDPVFLFSFLSEEEIKYWFTKNESIVQAIACHQIIKDLKKLPLQKQLQEKLDGYFRYFIDQFIAIKVMNLKKLERFNFAISREDYSKLYGYLSFDKAQEKAQIVTSKEKVNVLTQLVEDLDISFSSDETDQGKHQIIINKLMQAQCKKIEILSPDGSQTYHIQYPGFFIYARGHNLEEFIQKTFVKNEDEEGNNFKKWLINKIAISPEPLTLPMDLVDVIRNLNTRVREQANAVMKPSFSPLQTDNLSKSEKATTSSSNTEN